MGKLSDLAVYQKAFSAAMEIFQRTKTFPVEERFSLTDQIRKSSRSVCVNLSEGYRKRRYPAHFVSKVTDVDSENSETQVWLEFALACQYMSAADVERLAIELEQVGRLLQHTIDNPGRYGAGPAAH